MFWASCVIPPIGVIIASELNGLFGTMDWKLAYSFDDTSSFGEQTRSEEEDHVRSSLLQSVKVYQKQINSRSVIIL